MIEFMPGTEILLRIAELPGHRGAQGCLVPNIEQEGGWEIHPALEGITFQFWMDPANPPTVWVNQTPQSHAPEAPWASQLTGFLADDFSTAKRFLRGKAWALAEKAGFKFDPEKHGYRWI